MHKQRLFSKWVRECKKVRNPFHLTFKKSAHVQLSHFEKVHVCKARVHNGEMVPN